MHHPTSVFVSLAGAAALLLAGCGGDAGGASSTTNDRTPQQDAPKAPAPEPRKRPPANVRVDLEQMQRLFGGEPKAPLPQVKPTPEMAALGKTLFHDARLSNDGKSCASCHDLGKHGQDGQAVSRPGSAARNTPTVLDTYRAFAQGWDGRTGTVEEFVAWHVLDASGSALGAEDGLAAKVATAPELAAAFAQAFPDADAPVTAANTGAAIGAFLRTLATKNAFDAFLAGDARALSNDQKRGLKTFVDVGCTTCHLTKLVGGDQFQKLGLRRPWTGADKGRAVITGNAADEYFFKVPQLRHVAATGPWLHDGSIATLDEIVRQMGVLQLERVLTADEVTAIVAFLGALTGEPPAGAAAPPAQQPK